MVGGIKAKFGQSSLKTCAAQSSVPGFPPVTMTLSRLVRYARPGCVIVSKEMRFGDVHGMSP